MKTKLFPYQQEGVETIVHKFSGRALLADTMGLGKSIQALACIERLVGPRDNVVIVTPASIKWNWEEEAKRHAGLRSVVLETTKVKAVKANRARVWIINYDILGPWLPFLRSLKPKLVIPDECHYVRNPRTARTKNLRKLCKGVPYVIALSGTPLTNRPAELYPILNLICPQHYPAFYPYATEFCSYQLTPWGARWSGAKNLDKLHRELKERCMVRRTKAEVLKDLPSKSRQVITLAIDSPREYEDAERDLIGWLVKTSPRLARKAMSAEKMVKMGYLKRLAAKLKMKSVFEWVDNFLEEDDGKLILFAVHKKVIQELYARYKKQAVYVDGSVIGRQRQTAFKQFQTDKRTRVFIGNIQAAGVGWNGTVANTVAFVELGWVPGEHIQAEDRAHRIGTKKPVTVYYLVGKGTIEKSLCRILQQKQRVLDATLDGGRQKDSLAIYDQLEKILLEGR